jgi:hypothetical protein
MNDKELLELAAKAAGIVGEILENFDESYGLYLNGDRTADNNRFWNPLTDDGDALRLAVKLHIDLCINNGVAEAIWIDEIKSETHHIEEPCDEDFEGLYAKYAATRRAIVRAAAEIGKAL